MEKDDLRDESFSDDELDQTEDQVMTDPDMSPAPATTGGFGERIGDTDSSDLATEDDDSDLEDTDNNDYDTAVDDGYKPL